VSALNLACWDYINVQIYRNIIHEVTGTLLNIYSFYKLVTLSKNRDFNSTTQIHSKWRQHFAECVDLKSQIWVEGEVKIDLGACFIRGI
jgi:hypothetical protein